MYLPYPALELLHASDREKGSCTIFTTVTQHRNTNPAIPCSLYVESVLDDVAIYWSVAACASSLMQKVPWACLVVILYVDIVIARTFLLMAVNIISYADGGAIHGLSGSTIDIAHCSFVGLRASNVCVEGVS